jgi:hypothetical protein
MSGFYQTSIKRTRTACPIVIVKNLQWWNESWKNYLFRMLMEIERVIKISWRYLFRYRHLPKKIAAEK